MLSQQRQQQQPTHTHTPTTNSEKFNLKYWNICNFKTTTTQKSDTVKIEKTDVFCVWNILKDIFFIPLLNEFIHQINHYFIKNNKKKIDR